MLWDQLVEKNHWLCGAHVDVELRNQPIEVENQPESIPLLQPIELLAQVHPTAVTKRPHSVMPSTNETTLESVGSRHDESLP